MPPPTDNNANVRRMVDTILSAASSDDARIASGELFRFVCENRRPAAATLPKGPPAIAIDDGNECLVEILTSFFLRNGDDALHSPPMPDLQT